MNPSLSILLTLAALGATSATAAQDLVVKIGHVGPTSGPAAHMGKAAENGVRMAIAELQAQGLRIGGKPVRFELLAEDDAGDPKQATSAAQKLVDARVKGVIGHLNSGTSIPASRVYSDAGVPQISPVATNPTLTRQGYKTTFRMVTDDMQLGGTLGRYAVQTLKAHNIVVVDDRTAYGQGIAQQFSKAVKAAGGQIVDTQFTSDKAMDFTAILTAAKGKKVGLLFFGGMDAVAGPMLRQMKQLGIQARFMGGDGICTIELPRLAAGGVSDDQVVCAEAGGVEGQRKAGLEAFFKRYRERFGVEAQPSAPYAYDALRVMAAAMVKAGSAEPATYLPVLARTSGFDGATGPVTFDERGDLRNGALTLYTYAAGQRKQIAVVR